MTQINSNLPLSLYSASFTEMLDQELSQSIYSWDAGIRPVRTRISGYSALGTDLQYELIQEITKRESDVKRASGMTQVLSDEVGCMEICFSNSRSLMSDNLKDYAERILKLLMLRRRRARILRVLELLDNISTIQEIADSITRKNFRSTISSIIEIIETVPSGISAISGVRARIEDKTHRIQSEVISDITELCSKPSVELLTRLEQSYGKLSESILTDKKSFWYFNRKDSQLETFFMNSIFEKRIFQDIVSSDPFTNSNRCQTKSIEILESMITGIHESSNYITVIDDNTWAAFVRKLNECYLIFVFMCLSESDFSLVISPYSTDENRALDSVHEAELRRRKLRTLLSLVTDEFWVKYLNHMNRFRQRSGVKLSNVCVVIESIKRINHPATDEIVWSVYDCLVSNSLDHALSSWTSELLSQIANEHLRYEVSSFVAAFKCMDGGIIPESFFASIYPIIEETIIRRILGSLTSVDDESDMMEHITSLQQELSTVIPINKPKWSILYECLQILSLRSAELTYHWACEHISTLPLSLLTDIVKKSDLTDTEKRLTFIEQLEAAVIRSITDLE
jgi:hypothetical protein